MRCDRSIEASLPSDQRCLSDQPGMPGVAARLPHNALEARTKFRFRSRTTFQVRMPELRPLPRGQPAIHFAPLQAFQRQALCRPSRPQQRVGRRPRRACCLLCHSTGECAGAPLLYIGSPGISVHALSLKRRPRLLTCINDAGRLSRSPAGSGKGESQHETLIALSALLVTGFVAASTEKASACGELPVRCVSRRSRCTPGVALRPRPVARAVVTPGVGVRGTPMNRGGPVNRRGRR